MHKTRKMVVAALAAVSVAAAFAAQLNPVTCTADEVRAKIDEAFAQSNLNATTVYRYLATNNVFAAFGRQRCLDAKAELDARYAETPPCIPGHWWIYPAGWPKSSAVKAADLGADKAYVASIALAIRLGSSLEPHRIANVGDIDDLMVLFSDAVAFPEKCAFGQSMYDNLMAHTQKLGVKAVKKYIRSQGRSFVAKDGVNPCEEYMSGLTAALNAPRFAGLDAWLKSIGRKGVDLSKLPTEEYVEKLKRDILDGDKDMNERNTTLLKACLGVDGYNAFVREYNGD